MSTHNFIDFNDRRPARDLRPLHPFGPRYEIAAELVHCRGLVDSVGWRLYRDVERLHTLGPRFLFGLVVELAAARLCRSEIDAFGIRYLTTFAVREVRK